MTRCLAVGPSTARIAIVGEAPGATEEEKGEPFVGASGFELATMLKDAGIIVGEKNDLTTIMRSTVYLTNVCMDRPPNNDLKAWIGVPKTKSDKTEVTFRGKKVKPWVVDECLRLYKELEALKPNVIIACGNIPLWALTDKWGVAKWRGSQLTSNAVTGIDGLPIKVIPVYHPAAILRNYSWRFITVQDLKRAKREAGSPVHNGPSYNFITNPSFDQVLTNLRLLEGIADVRPLRLITDIEIKRKEIMCTGIAWSKRDAICIPFYHEKGHRWTPSEHVTIVEAIQRLFLHPNVLLSNQNIVSFETQYFFWKQNFWPKSYFDTMLAQNLLFPGLPRKLDFLASMYNEYYLYWKDDGKFWKDTASVIYPQLWTYNCVDCVATFEVMEQQEKAIKALGLESQWAFQMNRLPPKVSRMMMRGVKVDPEKRKQLKGELRAVIDTLRGEVNFLVGWKINIDSTPQMKDFFYTRLKLPVQRKKGKKDGQIAMVPTCDADAMEKLGKINPLIRPLCERINMVRSYDTVYDAVSSPLDSDGRWRTSYDIGGTETFRFSSSENPFGSGLNLQNLTIGKEIN